MWEMIIEYLSSNTDTYIIAIWEHTVISFLALIIAALIGVSAGFLGVRYQQMRKLFMSVFHILRVIPSLAILLMLIPVMGTGVRPATTALVLLAVPPILMNTLAGLDSVPDFILETASACGMTAEQIYRKVRFPLAMPLILAGLKTAAIEVIASATLAAKIGAGGLGEIIFTGLGLNRFDLLLIGGITVALLTFIVGLQFILAEKLILRYKHI